MSNATLPSHARVLTSGCEAVNQSVNTHNSQNLREMLHAKAAEL